jgi:hypothetical protein
MGVDIERIEETRYQTILSQLSQQELCWAKSVAIDGHKVVTALWTESPVKGSKHWADDPG